MLNWLNRLNRLAPWCWFASLAAQAPLWTFHEGQGNDTALAVCWQHGFDDDGPGECGAARVLADCRLERARVAVPGAARIGVQVFADATVAFVLVPAADWPIGLRFVQALLDEGLPLGDDPLALATARAALAADDAEWLQPGHVLGNRARQALLAGTAGARSVAGSAAAVAALTAARVRELLAEPVAVRCVAIGAVPAELRTACSAMVARPVAERPRALPHEAVHAQRASAGFPIHPRIDAPFVAAAFVAPPRDQQPAFAIGLEVARIRAAKTLPPRGQEGLGFAPVVGWSWLAGDPLVLFCRRGKNGGGPETPQAELEHFLAALRDKPPSEMELAAAVRAVSGELALPGAAPILASALPGRAIVALLAARRGIDPAAIAGVTAAAAHAALREALAPERAFWGGLLPEASSLLRPGTSR